MIIQNKSHHGRKQAKIKKNLLEKSYFSHKIWKKVKVQKRSIFTSSYSRVMNIIRFFHKQRNQTTLEFVLNSPPPDKFLSLKQGMVFKAHNHFSSLAPGF